MGVQRASYTIEGRSVQPLGNENAPAFALMASLNAEQHSKAVLGYASDCLRVSFYPAALAAAQNR